MLPIKMTASLVKISKMSAMSALAIFALPAPSHAKTTAPTVAEAEQFIRQAEARLEKLANAEQRATWVYQTHITDDTEAISVQTNELMLAATGEIALQARRYNQLPLSLDNKRKLKLMQLHLSFSNPKDRAEYAQLSAALTGAYGKATYCRKEAGERVCLPLGELEAMMAKSRNPAELKEIWLGWHQQALAYKDRYAQYVAASNKGAREMGFADTGAFWRAQYDMPPEAFAAETERLWQQVKPLYDSLHQYVRFKLQQTYGKDEVPTTGPIPAHLFGNMWSQTWDHLYPIVQPPGPAANLDLADKLKQHDAKSMVRMGEAFYTSLGMEALPTSFWDKSLFTKPRDREVVCHASAWDMGMVGGKAANQRGIDVRIKMCINPTSEDFSVIHHELGHIYYDMAYRNQPWLFKNGANDGFHESIGDTVVLSMTPHYLNKIGLLAQVPDASQEVGVLMNRALQNVAFLPFAYLVDQWRWKVYSGSTKPQDYDKVWWELREKYQGIKRPVSNEANKANQENQGGGFDAGAKYHVAADSSYAKYFVAAILQFQLHRALCREALYTGPLHRCSIYQNPAAGKKFQAMLSQGSSRPWQQVLKTASGEEQLDASAIIDYFAPLKVWLDAQNAALAKAP